MVEKYVCHRCCQYQASGRECPGVEERNPMPNRNRSDAFCFYPRQPFESRHKTSINIERTSAYRKSTTPVQNDLRKAACTGRHSSERPLLSALERPWSVYLVLFSCGGMVVRTLGGVSLRHNDVINVEFALMPAVLKRKCAVARKNGHLGGWTGVHFTGQDRQR